MATSAEKLVGSLADRISAKIFAGEYPPGSRLRQEALAEEFSVSRTPIREALRQLEVKGVIQHGPNQGAMVLAPNARDIRDAYQVRAELEGLAISLAVECDVSGRSAVRDTIAPTAITVSRTTATRIAAAMGSRTTRSAGSGGGRSARSTPSVDTRSTSEGAAVGSLGLVSAPGLGAVGSALSHRVQAVPSHQRNVLTLPPGSANQPESVTSTGGNRPGHQPLHGDKLFTNAG